MAFRRNKPEVQVLPVPQAFALCRLDLLILLFAILLCTYGAHEGSAVASRQKNNKVVMKEITSSSILLRSAIPRNHGL